MAGVKLIGFSVEYHTGMAAVPGSGGVDPIEEPLDVDLGYVPWSDFKPRPTSTWGFRVDFVSRMLDGA